MQYEKELREWSAIYAQLEAAQTCLKTALEAGDFGEVETQRKEVARLQAASDDGLKAVTALIQAGKMPG